ncbi:lasso peptide biosynthesis B2 protein [Metabacillus sp. GX 13764]|uniref:lasso peptide biosynthesis B2 protein n=1 Tax=Metabacillus kandeliae TaxID=2900151 RepID=UPI001E5B4209|nr:lasso peptide biosynthesis B2 protein [Metabacillus kandeliae]MCD7033163.1 lasso peptide biosynthesis B2 protein [Metabacillus kandeliae]
MEADMKKILFEAYIYLAWGRLLKMMKFSKVVPMLGVHMAETSEQASAEHREWVSKISFAIDCMSRYTFWESMCLVKGIAAVKMLERRKIESTLYLGTAKDSTGNMIAHAWVRSGTQYVTGKEEMKKFTVISTFANKFNY